jgi:hypothetical protein
MKIVVAPDIDHEERNARERSGKNVSSKIGVHQPDAGPGSSPLVLWV